MQFSRTVYVGLASSLLLGAAGAALAQAPRYDAAHWLNWRNNYGSLKSDFSRCKIGDAEAAQWDQSLRQIGRELAALAPTPPAGLFGSVHQTTMVNGQCGPLQAEVELGFIPPADTEQRPSKLHPGKTWTRAKSVRWRLSLNLNRLPELQQAGYAEPGGSPYYWVTRTGTLAGYPIYDRQFVIIPAEGRASPVVPVPAEKFINAYLRAADAKIAELVKSDAELFKVTHNHLPGFDLGVEAVRETVAVAKSTLARMTPAQKAAPAYSSLAAVTDGSVIAAPGPDVYAVVVLNPAYFDPKQPRTAPQLLVLDLRDSGDRGGEQAVTGGGPVEQAMPAYVRRVDWRKFAHLLH
jgi:hypothetical protein